MRVIKERGGWFIEAHTSDEQKRLEWLIESLQSHPDQQPCEAGGSGISNLTGTGVTQPENMMAFMSAVGGVSGYFQLRDCDPPMLKALQQAFSVDLGQSAT